MAIDKTQKIFNTISINNLGNNEKTPQKINTQNQNSNIDNLSPIKTIQKKTSNEEKKKG
jgi:hypothetical protein